MTLNAKFALAAILVLGLFVAGTAAQERRKSYSQPARQGDKLSPELKQSAEKLGAWQAGWEFMRDKDYERAAGVFKHAIRLWPDDSQWHYYLGQAYYQLRRFQDAIGAYKQAIRLKPDYFDAIISLGGTYMAMGRYDEGATTFRQAIRACKEVIRLEPDNTWAHYNLGMVYLTLKDRAAALEEYKILQKLNKKLANDLFNSIYK